MRHFRRFIVILSIIAVSLLFVPSGQAQQGASGLQISPTKHELTIEPGEVKQVSFIIKNITNIEITAKIELNDFDSDNLTGQPGIIVDKSIHSARSLRKFITGLENVDLKVGESKEVKINIDVPGDAAPGAYFGAIRFDATPKTGRNEQTREIALTASVAPLVLVQVNGDITEQIEIKNLTAARNDKSSKFFLSAPNKSVVTIKNLGNSFSKPFGKIAIQDIRGKVVNSYELNNTDPRGNVLPGSTRAFTDDISGVKFPGRYRMTASVAHGSGGEVVNYQSLFWYMPIWFILAVVVSLLLPLLVIIYILSRRRSGKHTNRYS